MWFFAFTFCWIYDRSAIAVNNLIALLCYSTGKAYAEHIDVTVTLYSLYNVRYIIWWIFYCCIIWLALKVIIVSGPIFFIVTASLGWRYAFIDPLLANNS